MASRRQNSSCDPCRRSKRRCAFQQGAPTGPGHTCLNCSNLGYKCTFEFVTTRAEQKRKRQAESEGRLRKEQNSDHPDSRLNNLSARVNITLVSGENTDSETIRAELDQAIASEISGLNDLNDEWPLSTTELPFLVPSPAWLSQPNFAPLPSPLSINENRLSGFWKGSPIKLLNSSVTANLLGACLDDAYKSMMYGMESRYLTYSCNPFTPSHKYCFGNEGQSNPDLLYNSIMSNDPMGNLVATPEFSAPFKLMDLQGSSRDGQEATKVTFVGLARFLDHFGNLYGNRLDRHIRKEDEDTLLAAQQAFALQWSPSDSPGTKDHVPTSNSQIFTTAWFGLQSRILNSKPHRSFTRLYAMLLFHMTNAPEEAKDVATEKKNVLNESLHQLLYLKGLVEDFCHTLGPTSIYRMLLESSVKVFQWFAYVKDTIASIISDREYILPDAPVEFNASHPEVFGWKSQCFDDEVVFRICQKAVGHNFQLFRQTVRVKKFVRECALMGNRSTLSDSLNRAINIVEDFDSRYGQFCDQCMRSFETFSDKSKLSFGFLILFWTLGVLSLVEEIQYAHDLGLITPECDVFLKACEFEERAIESGISISKHIVSMSENGPINVANGSVIKLPFISHHANIAPIAAVLVKMIEHIIKRNISTTGLLEADDTESMLMESWIPSIKPLLSCLVDLDTTVAGSKIAKAAFQRLMHTHGDILMDCWGVDESDYSSNWAESTYG